jgi:phosphate uptake regulator
LVEKYETIERMREIILDVLEEWSDLQPNMESETARSLLARDLCDALDNYVNSLIEEVVCGTQPKPLE